MIISLRCLFYFAGSILLFLIFSQLHDAISGFKISEVWNDLLSAQVIGIDEGQFVSLEVVYLLPVLLSVRFLKKIIPFSLKI